MIIYCEPVGMGYVNILTEDKEFIIEIPCGPGYWAKVVDKLRDMNYKVEPSDLSDLQEKLYWDARPLELLKYPDKMKQFGYFQYPQCKCVYHKHEFEHTDPCDNCRIK